ncbi:MAG: hypothetical protein ACRCZ2_10350 [Fusobacteriaceae bacterium]
MGYFITKSDLEVLNRAVTGIVYINFGEVCMEIIVHRENDEDIITLNVWDRPMSRVGKKQIINEEFIFSGLHETVSRIERFLIDCGCGKDV